MRKVRVALIGYGHLGKWHAQKAQQLDRSELVAIVDPSPKSQELAKEDFPGVAIVSSLHEIVEQIDAGLVVTPTSFHFDVCKELLENGKHIFCEKPVTSTLIQAQELLPLAKEKKVVFQVGHSERCHKVWSELEDYEKIIDTATVVNIVRTSPFKGRAADVGVVEDLMIHDIDLMRMFYGDPEDVVATGAKIMTSNWDYAKASFFYVDKVFHIENSRNDIKTERSIQFNGPHGVLRIDLLHSKLFVSKDISSDCEQVVTEREYEKRDHLLIEQEFFYDSILDNEDIFVTLEDGINAVNLIEKVNSSLESGELVEI